MNAPIPSTQDHSALRILVPLDGSSLAAKAMPVAEYLCHQLVAELHLVTVAPFCSFRTLVVRSISHRTPTTN